MDTTSCLTEYATEQLVKMLVERGYFHEGETQVLGVQEEAEDNDSMEAYQEKKPAAFSEMDPTCQLVSTNDGHYLTRSQLQAELLEELHACGGRLPFSDAATALSVSVHHAHRATVDLLVENDDLQLVGSDLISSQHLDQLATQVDKQLSLGDGHILISELASAVFRMPVDLTVQALLDRLQSRPMIRAKLLTIGGAKVLVSPRYEELQLNRIQSAFGALTTPATVESLCPEFGWDASFLLPLLRNMCKNGSVQGELHESESSPSGCMYVPTIYVQTQRKNINDFFSANGWITIEKCSIFGVPAGTMGHYVTASFPSSLVLSHSVINSDMILPPVEVAIQEAITAESFLDLKIVLPEDLVSSEKDADVIINELVLPSLLKEELNLSKDKHICIISDGEALFFSSAMIKNVEQSIVKPLVEDYARARAEAIDLAETKKSAKNSTTLEDDDIQTEGKAKRSKKGKGKKTTKEKKASSRPSDVMAFGVVPLVDVAHKVANDYADLADVQATHGSIWKRGQDKEEDAPLWEEGTGGGPLYEFCRVALHTKALRDDCSSAVKAELNRIKSTKNASVTSRKDGATRSRNIEHAFEDATCFPAACYHIQMLAKFVKFANSSEVDDAVLFLLKKDFLRGCANFARRITEFALWKNQLEDVAFLFQREGSSPRNNGELDQDGLPFYCCTLDHAVRHFPDVYLSCRPGADGKSRDPLKTMRELLPGNSGVAVARMWALCGGEYYAGGTRTSSEGVDTFRPGDFDKFLEHTEDSCLTICGLPFKKLDKKSEKQAMFCRRNELTRLLEQDTEAESVLEFVVMLLFQQVKGVMASGSLLSGPILDLLAKEKKIPASVSKKLKDLSEDIRVKKCLQTEMVRSVKLCGLSRDISKFQMD